MERKDFIKKFAVGGSILFTAPVFFSSCSDDDDDDNTNPGNPNEIIIDLNSASSAELGTVGGYIYSGSLIVFRTGDTSYKALARRCTHQGCDVTYSHTNGNVPCPCHGSVFTTSGGVTTGPANVNLKSYSVTKDGDMLRIS